MPVVCELTKQIHASPEKVFAALTDLPNAAGRIPAILKLELLTPGPVGLGTKFKETRKMFGKECAETMEVTAYEPAKRFEIGAGSCGCEFRTEFKLTPDAGGTRVDLIMNATNKSLFAKIIGPLTGWMMKGTMKKCMQDDLDHIAKHVETN